MSTFTTPLVVSPVQTRRDNPQRWRVVVPFEYHCGEYPSEFVITVPKGFMTDFASVPRCLWSLLPPYGMYGKAAVLHDYLYFTQAMNRKRCDVLFLEAMKVLGVELITRQAMYRAVRIAGHAAWKKYNPRGKR